MYRCRFPKFCDVLVAINLLELGGFSYNYYFPNILFMELETEKKINEIKQNTIIKQDDKEVVKYSKYVSG